MDEGAEGSAEKQKQRQAEVEHIDNRPKKLTGIELIKENVKELHEVIAYMDYSFERAFTIQEKQFMLDYKVRNSVSQLSYGASKACKNGNF